MIERREGCSSALLVVYTTLAAALGLDCGAVHGPKMPMLLFCEQSGGLPTLYVELHPVQADARVHTKEQLQELEVKTTDARS